MRKPGNHRFEKDLAWPVANGQLPYHIHHLSNHVHWTLLNCPSPPFLTLKYPAMNIIGIYDKIHFHFLSIQSWCQYVIFTFLSKKKIAQETTPSVWIKILNNEIQIEDPAIFRFELLRQKTKKSRTNATNAITHPHMQAMWWDIWKPTVEKSQTNATNATLHPFKQAIWGTI